MMLETDGNMREVFLAHAKENAEYERYCNEQYRRSGGFEAEIAPGTQGKWIVAITFPGQEGIAFAHLVGRRFGVLRPCFPETSIRRGRKVENIKTMFPNYLFVYVWDVQRHVRRILNCTGVQRILQLGDGPAIVPWAIINEIRAVENSKNPFTIPDDDGAAAAYEEEQRERIERIARKASKKKRKKKRKNKKAYRREALEQQALIEHKDEGHPNDVVATYSWGFRFGEMPEQERIGALHKALGLAA